MGWANCGADATGRQIGYAHEGVCDHPGCQEEIDRGLSFACGGMHGEDEISCARYFCDNHRSNHIHNDDRSENICDECAADAISSGYYQENEDGELVPASE